MNIFLKYITRTMLEKKLRLILFLLSIAVATGLFFASIGIVDVAVNAIGGQVLKQSEDRTISIQYNQPNSYFSLDEMNTEGIKNIQASLILPSVMQNMNHEPIRIHGRTHDSLQHYPLIEHSEADFNGFQVYISQRTASLHELNLGDPLDVLIANETYTFFISGIVPNDGIFYNDTTAQFHLIVPHETLASILTIDPLFNVAFANGSTSDLQASIQAFNDANEHFRASAVYEEDIVEQMVSGQRNIFYVMLGFVLLVSMIILYGSFKLIITERTLVIGTFFSQGATKNDVKRVLYIESLLYGLFGGILGVLFGVLLLFIAHRFTSPLYAYGIYEPFSFNPFFILYALIFSVGFSLLSCYIPIRKIGQYQVRDVILGQLENQKSLKKRSFFVGLSCITLATIIVFFFDSLATTLAPLLLILGLVGLLLIYPYMLSFFIKRIFKRLYGRVSFTALSMNNVRTSRALRGNISILIIALIAVLSVISLGKGTERIVTEAYTTLHFDIMVENIQTNDPQTRTAIMNDLKSNPLVKADTINEKATAFGTSNGHYASVEAINPHIFESLLSYLDFTQTDGSNAIKTLHDETKNHAIIAASTASRLNLEKGDETPLTINGITQTYTITGIVDGKLWMSGDFFMINIERYKSVHLMHNATIYFMTTEDATLVVDDFKEQFKNYGALVMTHDEMQQLNQEQNQMMFNILNYFSLFAVIVGAFGAINNMFISFLQRKKEFAVLQSIGGTSYQTRKLLCFESIFTILFSALIVSTFMYLHIKIMSKVAANVGLPLDISFVFGDVLPFILLSIAIYLIATIPLLYKSRHLSIIQEMRFE